MAGFGLWNDTLSVMLDHRTVRAFDKDKRLADGTLETLVAASQSAATSSNMQTWSVVAVTDPAIRAKCAIWAGNQPQINEAPLLLVWLADLSRAERIGAAAGREMEALPYTEAAMVAMLDAAIAAQNAAVAAESLGLSTCYIGALRNKPEELSAELGLPQQCFAVFGLCVGWPDHARPSPLRPRLPQDVVLHRERYNTTGEAAGIAAYETRFAEHQRDTGLPTSGWVARVLERLGPVRGLGGRHGMRNSLKALGFPLD
jgi:nitroreductase